MLTRLRLINFRCFEVFEFEPSRRQLILGGNGSGKSSFMEALLGARRFVVGGDKVAQSFPLNSPTRWLDQPDQSIELEAALTEGRFRYQLIVESRGDPAQPCVAYEAVHCNGRLLFEFAEGQVRLYDDEFVLKTTYRFDQSRSGLSTITERRENKGLLEFKQWLSGLLCFRINPFHMSARAEREECDPRDDLGNIAAWYRHLERADPGRNANFLDSLRSALDSFNLLKLESAGEDARLLVAEFTQNSGKSVKFRFNELSDGQRCLICLYTILHFVLAKGGTVVLDEPDNFISLREIQPWLMAVTDMVDEGKGQALLISHHPELINQWAPSSGVQFVRDGLGPVRVVPFHGDGQSSLSPAELVARGWENG